MATKAQSTEFIDIFRGFFRGFHGARIKTLLLLVQALASLGSINLVRLAAGLKTEVDPDSNYRRIQRFIHEIQFSSESLVPFLLKLVGITAPYTRILDRTNWQFGKAKINFLMLSVYGGGWSISGGSPVCVSVLAIVF
ncbi:MAG: hypothetical protein SH818_11595 [Saprospiraceae bacterium]|nr:hypothetical protein [Saprospiraceae bacterium]